MKINVISLLPMFLLITQQELGQTTLIEGVPLLTLPLLGFVVVALYGQVQSKDGHGFRMVISAMVLLLIPIALSVLIEGGGPMEMLNSLMDNVLAIDL